MEELLGKVFWKICLEDFLLEELYRLVFVEELFGGVARPIRHGAIFKKLIRYQQNLIVNDDNGLQKLKLLHISNWTH